MELVLNRIFKGNEYIIGELYIDGIYQCDTLEDRVRPLPEVCPNTPKGISCTCKEKVYGSTAIPAGIYQITLNYSNKYKKTMPEILNVPHFLGIRLHSGNTTKDTEGCILLGEWDESKGDWVSNSRVNYNKVFALLKKAFDSKEEITIQINN